MLIHSRVHRLWESLLHKATARDEEPWTYTVWDTAYSDARYKELQLVTTWTKWGVSADIEVDEYSNYDGKGLKRRWWFGVQIGPLHLVLSTERRVS